MAKRQKKQEAEKALEQPEETLDQETPAQDREEDLNAQLEALMAQRQEYEAKLRELEVMAELRRRGLSGDLAPYLTLPAGEDVKEWMDGFEALFREALVQAMTERLRGLGAPKEPTKAHGYSRGELRGLSAQEINAHWEEVARALRE